MILSNGCELLLLQVYAFVRFQCLYSSLPNRNDVMLGRESKNWQRYLLRKKTCIGPALRSLLVFNFLLLHVS